MKKYIRPSVVIKRFNEECIVTDSSVGGKDPDSYLKDYSDSESVRLKQVEYGSVFGYHE